MNAPTEGLELKVVEQQNIRDLESLAAVLMLLDCTRRAIELRISPLDALEVVEWAAYTMSDRRADELSTDARRNYISSSARPADLDTAIDVLIGNVEASERGVQAARVRDGQWRDVFAQTA